MKKTNTLISRPLIWLFLLTVSLSVFAAEKTPEELKDLEMNPILGTQVSLDTEFQNEDGKMVKLRSYFDGKRPVALIMNYYECPMLCGLVLNAARDSFQDMDWKPGENFQIITVSINPKEEYTLAAAKKESILGSIEKKEYVEPMRSSWHFLVGKKENSEKLAQEIGFKYKYIPEEKQYAHGAAMFLLSPTGKLTRVLFGMNFAPRDLKLGLLEASEGKVGTIAEKLLLFCYHYDPKGNQYAILATNVMKLGGAITVMVLGFAYLLLFLRKRRKG